MPFDAVIIKDMQREYQAYGFAFTGAQVKRKIGKAKHNVPRVIGATRDRLAWLELIDYQPRQVALWIGLPRDRKDILERNHALLTTTINACVPEWGNWDWLKDTIQSFNTSYQDKKQRNVVRAGTQHNGIHIYLSYHRKQSAIILLISEHEHNVGELERIRTLNAQAPEVAS